MGGQGDAFLWLRQAQAVGHLGQRRGDAWRLAGVDGGLHLAVALGVRWCTAGQAGVDEQALQVGWPELEHLQFAGRRVEGRAGGLAGSAVDHHRAVQVRYADRRHAGDVPGLAGLRAPAVGQLARRGADLDAGQPRRRPVDWRAHLWQGQRQGVGDAEEQRRGGLDADEGRVRRGVEVAHPHHQHVGSDQAGAPGIVEAPGGTGLPGHRPVATARIGGQAVRARVVAQHVADHERRLRRQQLGARFAALFASPAQRAQTAVASQHQVQPGQFGRGQLAAAEGQGQAVELLFTQALDAGALQQAVQ